jgi:hypothetical protein
MLKEKATSMEIKMFYSWQSDRPTKTNQNLIQEAIEMAIKRIDSDDGISVEPVLDRDTQDKPGSPAIAQTILEKIDQCDLFLCDVTLITPRDAQRPAPNPNVLIELGYAAAQVGWERIICVMNVEFGGPSKLPFDLKHRRWPVRYRLSEKANENNINEQKHKLSEEIGNAIRTAMTSGVLVKTVDPKDRRVALKFRHALTHFSSNFGMFLRENGLEEEAKLFGEDHEDLEGTNYPSPTIVESIVQLLLVNNLKSQSNMSIGEQTLIWADAFIHNLTQVAGECERILNQYADRDDALISLVEDIQERAQFLILQIQSPYIAPQLAHLWDHGVPDGHIDWFRFFLLTMLKSYRVIRQFVE